MVRDQNPELLRRAEALFDKLVPAKDNCETLEGEFIRAFNRIMYRLYNDGDYWFTDYGCTTVGPVVAFLKEYSSPTGKAILPEKVLDELVLSDGKFGDDYVDHIEAAGLIIVEYVEAKGENLTPNTEGIDMFNFESEYDDEEEDDDDYEDYDDEDDYDDYDDDYDDDDY